MALGNIFEEEETCDSGGLIFVDKDTEVKCYHDDIVELAICGSLTMDEARQAAQCLANI